jgi:hypothetical protein
MHAQIRHTYTHTYIASSTDGMINEHSFGFSCAHTTDSSACLVVYAVYAVYALAGLFSQQQCRAFYVHIRYTIHAHTCTLPTCHHQIHEINFYSMSKKMRNHKTVNNENSQPLGCLKQNTRYRIQSSRTETCELYSKRNKRPLQNPNAQLHTTACITTKHMPLIHIHAHYLKDTAA